MLNIFHTQQSSSSILMSVLLNIAIIIFIGFSIKREGTRYLPIKIAIGIYISISTIALLLQL